MKRRLRDYFTGYMLRPVLYKIFARFLYSLTGALLWNRFVNRSGVLSIRVNAFAFLGALFLGLCWLAYLRLDGLKVPALFMAKPDRGHGRKRSWGDIADHMDEKPVSFDELSDDERDFCCLAANGFCGVVLLLISIF